MRKIINTILKHQERHGHLFNSETTTFEIQTRDACTRPPPHFRAVIKGRNPQHLLQLRSLDITGNQSAKLKVALSIFVRCYGWIFIFYGCFKTERQPCLEMALERNLPNLDEWSKQFYWHPLQLLAALVNHSQDTTHGPKPLIQEVCSKLVFEVLRAGKHARVPNVLLLTKEKRTKSPFRNLLTEVQFFPPKRLAIQFWP